MEAAKVAKTGLILCAAGAGAYFMFSKKYAPTRQRLAEAARKNTKLAIEEVSNAAGKIRTNAKTALADVADITATASKNL